MGTTRVHLLEKELGIETKDLIVHLDRLGLRGRKAHSALEGDEVARVHATLTAQERPRVYLAEEKIVADRVVKRHDDVNGGAYARETVVERRVRANVISRRVNQTEVSPSRQANAPAPQQPLFDRTVISEIQQKTTQQIVSQTKATDTSKIVPEPAVDSEPLATIEMDRWSQATTTDISSSKHDLKARTKRLRRVGYIEEIIENGLIVTLLNDAGIVHSFRIPKQFIPGQSLDNFTVNEEVVIELSLKTHDRIILKGLELTGEEIRALPIDWKFDVTSRILNIPACIEKSQLKMWHGRRQIADSIHKNSWLYAFNARIINSKHKLSLIKNGHTVVAGTGRLFQMGDGQAVELILTNGCIGFAFCSDLFEGVEFVPEGDAFEFKVLEVIPESGYLRLMSEEQYRDRVQRMQELVRRLEQQSRHLGYKIQGIYEELGTIRTEKLEEQLDEICREDRKILDRIASIRRQFPCN